MADNCYAVEDPQIQPAMRLISAATKANPVSITTTFDHDFVDGTIVRFHIPKYYGMPQLDLQQGAITVTGTDTFTINLDTTNFTAFAVPVALWWHSRCALVIPIGELSDQLTAAARDVR